VCGAWKPGWNSAVSRCQSPIESWRDAWQGGRGAKWLVVIMLLWLRASELCCSATVAINEEEENMKEADG